ncbi:hypothetical protein C8Q80DRAFT_1272186 [Daedaleopsis nitida]|nr:hypothetical protein C8Q80DRAFT_1272186 [Daedaleopsis nitida]
MLPRFATYYRPLVSDRAPWTRSRYTYLAAGLTVFLASLYLLGRYRSQAPLLPPVVDVPSPQPPLYSEYHEAELRLPQQDWDKKWPSEDEKFLFVAGHTRALGWGNAVQEHLLNAYLAYRSGRRFVMGNFTWNDDGSLYSEYNDTVKIPSQIPYSAIIRGPVVGGPFPRGDHAPLAVSKDYFDHLCPSKHEIDRNEVHGRFPPENRTSAAAVTEVWSNILSDSNASCVQTSKDSGPIYTHNAIFGVRKSLEKLWPEFAASPIITLFGWSTLVEVAFDMNRHFFLPKDSLEPFLSTTPFTTNAQRYSMIPGLMAVHIRRGDYKQHCTTLTRWGEDFVSVNTFPDMPDQFTIPPHNELPDMTDVHLEYYRKRCFPSIEEIVHKVVEVLDTPAGHGVRRLYIMTNGRPTFISKLKAALHRVAEWDSIASSRDMVLNREQRYVPQAVDQLVAQRAQVFIGNGFSTLTSNAVSMRMANGFSNHSSRLW